MEMYTVVPFLPTEEEEPLPGVSDFRGRPVCHANSGGWRSAFFVVGTLRTNAPCSILRPKLVLLQSISDCQ